MIANFISTISNLPWAEYGIAGLCIFALFRILLKILKRLDTKEIRDSQNYQELLNRFLTEINSRDEKFIELQKQTLEALYQNKEALHILSMKIEEECNEK